MSDFYSLFLRPRSDDVDLKADLERIYGVPFELRNGWLLAAADETFVEATLVHHYDDDGVMTFSTHPWEVSLRPRPGRGGHEREIAMRLFHALDATGRYDAFLTYDVTEFIVSNTVASP